MGTVGFLHTAQAHVSRFDRLMIRWPEHRALHHVDEALLLGAASGDGDSVRDGVRAALQELSRAGAEVVVCTCSTLGAVAEEVIAPVAVLRVDRPMAAVAVQQGPRIGVVVTLDSSVEPSAALLREEADRAGFEVAVEVVCVEGAWARFASGDAAGHSALVVAAARDLAARSDVLVLAQVSMTDTAQELHDLAIPVLTSPAEAVRQAVTLLGSADELSDDHT